METGRLVAAILRAQTRAAATCGDWTGHLLPVCYWSILLQWTMCSLARQRFVQPFLLEHPFIFVPRVASWEICLGQSLRLVSEDIMTSLRPRRPVKSSMRSNNTCIIAQ